MKTNKLILLFGMLLSMLATNASAYDFAVKNADSVMIYYNYTNNNTEVEVTYKTETDYYDYSGSVVIPKEVTYENKTLKVTGIGEYAFTERDDLTSITIPNSVTSIGKGAFEACFSLTSITIPNSVKSIGERAFAECGSLTSITIPNSVTSIGKGAFEYCCNLTSITIPNSVTSIEDETFYECSGLTSITIPNSVTSIGENVFVGCYNLQKVVSKIVEPFEIAENTFSDETYSKVPLYVPKGTVAKYKASDGWKNFKNILEEDTTTGIDDVEAVEPDNTLNTSKRIYDINGKRMPATSLDELPSGLYIVNGKKVVK